MGRAYWNRGEDACGTVIGEFMSTYLYECYMRGRESLKAEVVRKLIWVSSVPLVVQYAFELHVASAPGQGARGGRQYPGELE